MIDYDRPPEQLLRALGERAKQVRLLRNLQQKDLAARAGIGVATVQRFETTGSASIENVLRIALALRVESGFDNLFQAPRYTSIDEAIARPNVMQQQRVKRRKK